jgi:uncharacterized linocin/CFP29 family protein
MLRVGDQHRGAIINVKELSHIVDRGFRGNYTLTIHMRNGTTFTEEFKDEQEMKKRIRQINGFMRYANDPSSYY